MTQEKEWKKKLFLKNKPCNFFTNFTIVISSFCLSCTYSLFFFSFLFNIIIFTIFSLISFTTFYYWVILEILQILLLMSYKLVSHQSQKIISNIYSLYFLINTNHIFTTSVCKICSSYDYELVFCLFILILWNIFIFSYNYLFILLLLLINIF